jgi:hypothetical protein
MIRLYIGVVRFQDDRDFVMMVDGEAGPVTDAVKQVMAEIWGEGDIKVLAEGVDFIEFIHDRNRDQARPDGYVVSCEAGGLKRMNYAIQNARRLRHMSAQPPAQA